MIDKRIYQVEFDAENHKYFYTDENKNHRELHGITSNIGKLMGKHFPDTMTVQIATIYGKDVHSESERWIKENKEPSTKGGKWVVETLKKFAEEKNVVKYHAELLVSDFIGTASCIDIVAIHKDGTATLFDIKTCSVFQRESFSLQLSVYKKLYEACYDEKVKGLYVLGTKSERLFHILEQEESKVQKVLDMNKVN